MSASVKCREEGSDLLLAHYIGLFLVPASLPARDRLDTALGGEMARRLVQALTRYR